MSARPSRDGTAVSPPARSAIIRRRRAVLLVLPLLVAATPLLAQPAPAPRPPAATSSPQPSPLFEPTRQLWEALPLERRTAIQEALVWSGDYAGSLDGTFGKMTFDALSAFLSRRKLGPDAVGGEVADKAFAEITATKKAAVGWQMVTDAATGVRIGVPTRVVGASAKSDGGSRWPSKDGRVELRTHKIAGTDLAKVFDLVRADTPGRRITYAVLRPDWFVVADDLGGKRGYARFVRGPSEIRGFTFSFDAPLGVDLDRVVIATAGTFEPFPGAAPAAPATAPTASATPAQPAATTPQASAPAAALPPSAGLVTGLVVAPGKVLTTAAAVADCRNPTVAGRPAKPDPAPAGPGLALFAVDGTPAPILPTLAQAAAGTPVVALAAADGAKPTVVSGKIVGNGARLALQRGGGGAVVADLSGRVVGLVAARPDESRLIAGLVPETTYPLIGATELAAASGFRLDTAQAAPDVTAKVVTTLAPAVVTLTCGR